MRVANWAWCSPIYVMGGALGKGKDGIKIWGKKTCNTAIDKTERWRGTDQSSNII
jgi:hypothetical protein